VNLFLKFHYESVTSRYDSFFYDLFYFLSKKNYLADFKEEVAHFLKISSEHLSLFSSARMSLNAILKSVEVGPESEVIVLPFTCEVVIDSVLETGARVIYSDINEETLSFDFEKLAKKVTSKTRVIIVQYSYVSNELVSQIKSTEKFKDIYVIEDCALTFGSKNEQGELLGTLGDAAIFSFDKTKIFSTVSGGASFVRSEEIAKKVEELSKNCKNLSTTFLLSLIFQKYLLYFFTCERFYKLTIKVLSIVNRFKLLKDFSVTFKPREKNDYLYRMSNLQAYWGLRQIKYLQENLNSRGRLKGKILEILKRNNICYPMGIGSNVIFPLRIPIYLNWRPNSSKVEFGDWFRSFALGYNGEPEELNYFEEEYPVAQNLHKTIYNLPCFLRNPSLEGKYLSEVENLLKNPNLK